MPPSNTNMSMTGLNDTSPTCSSSTPNDPPDADPEIPTSNDANPDTRTANYNMTVWIWAGNYISFTIAAGLIRLHMPGVKKSRV